MIVNRIRIALAVTLLALATVSAVDSASALLNPEQGGKQIPLGDGVDQNDALSRLP
jgi:hypothetical protein